MPNYDIYDDTSPTNQYRDVTARLRFNREDGMETFDQPPAYSALEYSPSMSDEEQVMLTRAPRELLPPKRALFQPDPNPIPLDTRSIRRLEKYRSGFPYRSNFSGLGATISGDRKKVVEKLQKWASTYDKYSVELERLANSTAKMYSKGYLTCAQAQKYNGYAMYFWKSMLDLADALRGVSPEVAAKIQAPQSPLFFTHSIHAKYGSGDKLVEITPILDCNEYGLVAPGASFQTVSRIRESSDDEGGLGATWVWAVVVFIGGLMTALITYEFGKEVIQPLLATLSGVDHKRLELEQQLQNLKIADKRIAYTDACVEKHSKPDMTEDQKISVIKMCNDRADKLFPFGKLPNKLGIFDKLLIAGGVGIGGWLLYKWYKNRQNR